jgi:hypothetical protein
MTGKHSLSKYLLALVAIAALAALFAVPASADGWVRGIVLTVDGKDYYMVGAPDAPSGAYDIPGHSWMQTAPNRVVGLHYNTGPFGAPSWWATQETDGKLLFTVEGIIDTWSPGKARRYARLGYVHYHELRLVEDSSMGGTLHPRKVVWLRHTALDSFLLDGGPHPPEPPLEMTPGIAYNFLPNWDRPYSPE